MPELVLHGQPVGNVFDLLGRNENDMTFALGWGLARSEPFLGDFLGSVGIEGVDPSDCFVELQKYRESGGFTDIEISAPSRLHLIVEAKRDWMLPSGAQLGLYMKHLDLQPGTIAGLVVLTQWGAQSFATTELGRLGLPVPYHVVGWSDLAAMARRRAQTRILRERYMLEALADYLRSVADMRDITSNSVYVVSLSRHHDEGWPMDWVQVVEDYDRYFFPANGVHWPKNPPNYLAFRYDGRLQAIRHVDGYSIATDMSEFFPGVPSTQWDPHFVVSLGPPIRPSKPTPKGGGIHRSARVWVDIDLLLTADTITDALQKTKDRRQDG